jgi:hypothetical protein
MHSATSRVLSIAPSTKPSTTISLEKHMTVNKYPQLSQILGMDFDPSESGTNKLIQTVLSEIIDILHPGVGEKLKVKNRSNHKRVLFISVPFTSSEKSFNKSKAWLDRVIAICWNPNRQIRTYQYTTSSSH